MREEREVMSEETVVLPDADESLREQVRSRYAAAARWVTSGGGCGCGCGGACGGCCGASAEADTVTAATASGAACCGPAAPAQVQAYPESAAQPAERFGAALYPPSEQHELPAEAVAASLGCGNPTAVADLREGETVLDLGSGGGIDVLLSARRVGPAGFVYGVDMTEEMLDLARANAAKAGAGNVRFLHGTIEEVPLPDEAVDVVISNCVVNLSVDKPAVLAEMFRLLRPGGRVGISDVIAEDHLSPADRAERGSYVGCIAGALSRTEYLDGLAAVGFVDATVEFTHEAVPGMHGAIVRAVKPAATGA
jgi:arsenite methyltransferase